MQIVEPPQSTSIMAIAAHPDDIESWCAGTLSLAIAEGALVRLLLVTSGERGSSDPDATPSGVAALREDETREAARILGIAEVVFLHYPDGDVENTRGLRHELVGWIRRWRPTVLFTHDPEQPYPRYLSHRDHRMVGRAALDAVYPLARDRLAVIEHAWATMLEPHIVSEVWLFASAIADSCVDISVGFDAKIAARLAHVSQTPNPQELAINWRNRAAAVGSTLGVPLGEAFTIIRIV